MSRTCHTTTAAISIGLPEASLTLSLSPFRVRARSEILTRLMKGFIHQNPFSLIVPLYFPKRMRTAAWFGWTTL